MYLSSKKVIVLCAFALLITTNAFAIKENGFGITTKFSTDESLFLGFAWHPIQILEIRPHVLFLLDDENTEYDTFTGSAIEKDFRIGAGTDILFFIDVAENLYAYVGPGIRYLYREYTERDENDPNDNSNNYDYISHFLEIDIIAGGQYMFVDQFGIYGEISVEFELLLREFSNFPSFMDSSGTFFEIQTLSGSVGVVFYF